MRIHSSRNLFAILIGCVILTACGQDNAETTPLSQDTESDTATASESITETKPRLQPNIPENEDFQGYTYRALTKGQYDVHWNSKDVVAEDITGDPVNDAVYARNETICNLLNIQIQDIDGGSMWPTEWITKAVQGNEDAFDIMLLGNTVHPVITQGMMLDLHTVPYLDLSQPWYDQNANASLSIGGKLYLTAGEMTIMDNDATWTILFNKGFAEDMGAGDLYQTVKDGKWTMDVMYALMENASSDENGNGIRDQEDKWGLAGEPFNTSALMLSAGCHFVEKDADDMPVLTAENEKFYDAFRIANQLNGDFTRCLYVENYRKNYTGENVWTECMDRAFTDGRVLFYYTGLNRVSLFRGMETDFGILPSPKLNEEQENYYNAVSLYCANMMSIPKTVRDPRCIGIITEALSAESLYTLTPAYYEQTLKTRDARDAQSADMLDLIFASRVFDLANEYGWGGLFDYPGSLTTAGKSDLASGLKTILKASQAEMQKTLKTLVKNED